MSVFHPPVFLPACSAERRADLIRRMRIALTAEHNYYVALYQAGGLTVAQRDEYYASHEATEDALRGMSNG